MASETDIRAWAERTAPTLTDEDWRVYEALARGEGAVGLMEAIQTLVDLAAPEVPPMRVIRALLSYVEDLARDMDGDDGEA